MKIVPFEEIQNCDLIIVAVYVGSSDRKLAGKPISNSAANIQYME